MKQFQEIKDAHRDAIVFFRLGDFYEMFGEDAVTASGILQIALTTRDRTSEEPTPMCGVPYFAADSYLQKLVAGGHKVAICEQVQDPKEARGVVKREVVRVITPGTVTPENPKENNYIISFLPLGNKHGVAAADVSTGEFMLFETENPLEDEIEKFEPGEVVYPESLGQDLRYAEMLKGFHSTAADDFLFEYSEAYRELLSYFKVSSLDAFGCEGFHAAVSAAGALLSTLRRTQKEALSFEKLTPVRDNSQMFIDASTRKNLELVQNLREGSREGTLLWVLDETLTPMGGRHMRQAVLRPLKSVDDIKLNLFSVRSLTEDYELLDNLRNVLRGIQDIERFSTRVQMGTANARDLIALKNSLKRLPQLKKALLQSDDEQLKEMARGMREFSQVVSRIEASLSEHPPVSLRDGGLIKDGCNREVDELRLLQNNSREYIARLEAGEKEKTGINSLKVGFNKIFGYYIEITRPNLPQVPGHYIRKQTLVNAERFITPELKEYETKALGAEERLKALEYELFQGIAAEIKDQAAGISQAGAKVGKLDFLVSLAVVAKRNNYVMPQVDPGLELSIVNGRHPVVEKTLQAGERFIPNGIQMDGEGRRMLIITGPNMAGKSTYMRQNAIIVLMAQIGSFVPADEARIGVADRVFTRIGASDFLSMGQSTFMVEMLETANILHNATGRSLIILDEVGRGTSTFDGISIAWAAAEYIANTLKARTMFATHYHELTELGHSLEGVANCNVAVREWGEEIIFLRKIEDGPSDKSYGIQVARLAGLPPEIVDRAKSVLANLEKQILNSKGMPRLLPVGVKNRNQLSLFGSREDYLVRELLALPDGITAEEAMKALFKLKKALKESIS